MKALVLVNPANPKSRIVAAELPSGRKIEVKVSVSSDLNRPGKFEPATINWSAVGAVSPEDADVFADTIKSAVGVARGLDSENGS